MHNNNKAKNTMVTVVAAAQILRTYETYVYSLIRTGHLTAVKVNGRWKLDRKVVEAYRKSQDQRRRGRGGVDERERATA